VAFIGEVILTDTEILAPLIGGFQVFLFEETFHQLTLHAPLGKSSTRIQRIIIVPSPVKKSDLKPMQERTVQ